MEPKVIARVQLRALWVDVDMVKQSICKIKKGYEYIDYDKDTNYALGADVFTTKALLKASRMINKISDKSKKRIYEFSPWALLMNNKKLFKVGIVNYRNMWDKNRVNNLKRKLDHFIGKEENKQGIDPENPGSRYSYIQPYLKDKDFVLDIACGQGGGTKFLSQFCNKIIGVDINSSYINNAVKLYSNDPIAFHCMTDNELTSLGTNFDKIISLHTLEHVDNDKNFLLNLKKRTQTQRVINFRGPKIA